MTANKNGAGAEAVRTMEWRPYADAADVGVGEQWVGKPGQHSVIWASDTVFTLFMHDGFTPGGHPVGGGGPGGPDTTNVLGTAPINVVQSPNDTFTVSVAISAGAGNRLTAALDGLFVPAVPTPPAPEVYTGSGTVLINGANVVSARVNSEAHAYLTATGTGLLVAPIDTISNAAASVTLTAAMAGDLILLTGDAPVLVLTTQAVGGYVVRQETTVVSYDDWTITVPDGVTLNNLAGPRTFTVKMLPDGVMFKRIGDNVWLGLGDARFP